MMKNIKIRTDSERETLNVFELLREAGHLVSDGYKNQRNIYVEPNGQVTFNFLHPDTIETFNAVGYDEFSLTRKVVYTLEKKEKLVEVLGKVYLEEDLLKILQTINPLNND